MQTEKNKDKSDLDPQIVREADGRLRVGSIRGVPDLSTVEIGEIAAWYLGPRAENEDIFRTMIKYAVDKTVAYRHSFEPDDPPVITAEVRNSAGYRRAIDNMLNAYEDLVDFLHDYTTPYFSMRYQGHMIRDNTLPALCGYFAAMLHNPNNVSIQASCATTPLELVVGRDLCGMVGLTGDEREGGGSSGPWAHITCDGTVANIEACWSMREAKFLPLALHRMLREEEYLTVRLNAKKTTTIKIDNARNPIPVITGTGEEILLTDDTLDRWLLLNLPLDVILSLPKKIAGSYGIDDEYSIWSSVVPYTLNYRGWAESAAASGEVSAAGGGPVIIAPVTMHYSLLKAAALLGYGFGESGGVLHVPVDTSGRMDMDELETILFRCLDKRVPVSQVVAVVGTTEEGAVDNMTEILRKQEKFRKRGLEFFIHADSAWGGYMISAMRTPFTFTGDRPGNSPEGGDEGEQRKSTFIGRENSPFSDYVYEQFRHLRQCESITIDPHKMGYVQYPAGSVLYRNGTVRRLTTFTGPYIGGTGTIDPGEEPTVGIFGIEGSKPGASAASVFMSHRVIRPDISGHGKIIRQSMLNTRLFALHLLSLGRKSRYFNVTLLNPGEEPSRGSCGLDLPAEDAVTVAESLESGKLRNFGPDLNILNYVFNPIDINGRPNRDIGALNEFNLAVYNRFHVPVTEKQGRSLPVPMEDFPKLFITMTTFGKREYGGRFMEKFLHRIFAPCAEPVQGGVDKLVCLRSVIMDPFMAYTRDGDFFRVIMRQLERTLIELVEEWRMASPSKQQGKST